MDYTKYATKAFTKVKKYGSPVTITRARGKEYDIDKDEYTDTGTQFGGFALQSRFEQRDIDGTNIMFGDIKFMAVLYDKPMTDDTITFEGSTYTIKNVFPLNPNGKTNIYYIIQAR